MTNWAIAANGLRKSYGDKVVLDGVDLVLGYFWSASKFNRDPK